MNEKVSISDINIPNNFKDIKTNYNITLYDKDTGEVVYSTDGHNKLNPNLGLRPWSTTYGARLTSCMHLPASEYTSDELPSAIYFYNSPDDPTTNHVAGPQRGTLIGAGRLGSSNSAASRCSYNPTESNFEIVYEDGIAYRHAHIVLDATTSQLNGEINTVVIGGSRYLDVFGGVFSAGFYIKSTSDFSGNIQPYNGPLYGKNASLMSYHPDRPAWQSSSTTDSSVYGSWSIESDNTVWFAPHRRNSIANADDIVLFHYDLKAWKVLGTIKLSLPAECIGKDLITYKFDDCIVVYPRRLSSYSEDSSGNPKFSSNPMYVFNLNGDYVKSVGRSLDIFDSTRSVVINNKIYYWSGTATNTHYGFIVFDSELNMLGGVRMSDYLNDSRFGKKDGYGPYANSIRPVFIVDNVTGDHRVTLSGVSTGNKNYIGETNLSWNMKKGQIEWLSTNDICTFLYPYSGISSYRLACVLDGLPYVLPADGYAVSYWPFIWHHWCKLPSPVTKTANTTMKIQIDLYYPLVSPFAFAAPAATQASSTESE